MENKENTKWQNRRTRRCVFLLSVVSVIAIACAVFLNRTYIARPEREMADMESPETISREQARTMDAAEIRQRFPATEGDLELAREILRDAGKSAEQPAVSVPQQPSDEQRREAVLPWNRPDGVVVTLQNGSQVHVSNIRLRERAAGVWLGGTPRNDWSELHYRVQKGAIKLVRTVPFSEIETIDFVTGSEEGSGVSDIHAMTVTLRDGGTIEWSGDGKHQGSVTVTSPGDQKETLESGWTFEFSVGSAEDSLGRRYNIECFFGTASVAGEKRRWEAKPEEIRQIRFGGRK